MGLVVCKFPDDDKEFLLYDKEEFNPEEFNLVKVKDTTVQESLDIPVLKLTDFVLRTMRPKERTDTHILGEIGLETISDLFKEKQLIDQKKSRLSKSQRDIVVKRYNEVINL